MFESMKKDYAVSLASRTAARPRTNFVGISFLSGDGELMMTILASYAQEESRSASENQK